MDDAPNTPAAETPRPRPSILGCLSVFVALAIGAVGARVLAPDPAPPEPELVVRATPSVVLAVSDLARLETARFHMERVIDLRDRQSTLFGLVDAEDALLLVAAADVSAGVDLTRMTDGDVVVDPDRMSATLTLPAPEIFDAHLDEERTYVHSRNTDALAERGAQLESRARREAAQSLRRAALDAGILERARDNARSAITTLVTALGYDEVIIRFEPSTQ